MSGFMAYTALGRCASSGAVYAINPSFSVFNSNLNTHETVFFCFSSVINFPVITFILKNAGLKVITKNNNRLHGYYGKINDLRNRKQYGLMSI